MRFRSIHHGLIEVEGRHHFLGLLHYYQVDVVFFKGGVGGDKAWLGFSLGHGTGIAEGMRLVLVDVVVEER